MKVTVDNDTGVDATSPAADVLVDPAFLDPLVRAEWEHFAAYGWSPERIAARLGLNWDSLVRAQYRRLAS